LFLLLSIPNIIVTIIWLKKSLHEGKATIEEKAEEAPSLPKEAPPPAAVRKPYSVSELNDNLKPMKLISNPSEVAPLPVAPVVGGESRFDACLIQLIGHNLLRWFLFINTFTIAFPWANAGHQR